MDGLNSTQLILSLLAAIGFGGIVGAYFQSRFQHQKEIQEDIHKLKRQRYGAILIQMLTILDSKHGLSKAQQFRPDLENVEDFKQEVKIEMLNSVLFANDEVIKTMAAFGNNPVYPAYIKTALAMRKDVWNKKTKIREDVLKAFASND